METSIYKPLASSSSRRIISELLFHFKELSLDDRYITAQVIFVFVVRVV